MQDLNPPKVHKIYLSPPKQFLTNPQKVQFVFKRPTKTLLVPCAFVFLSCFVLFVLLSVFHLSVCSLSCLTLFLLSFSFPPPLSKDSDAIARADLRSSNSPLGSNDFGYGSFDANFFRPCGVGAPLGSGRRFSPAKPPPLVAGQRLRLREANGTEMPLAFPTVHPPHSPVEGSPSPSSSGSGSPRGSGRTGSTNLGGGGVPPRRGRLAGDAVAKSRGAESTQESTEGDARPAHFNTPVI